MRQSPGYVDWQIMRRTLWRADFDDIRHLNSLPLKKARPGQGRQRAEMPVTGQLLSTSWMPESRCVTCKRPPRTPIRAPRCGMTGPRGGLDRHATYIVAAYVAGAAR